MTYKAANAGVIAVVSAVALAAVHGQEPRRPAAEQPDLQAVIEKAIKVHGGAEALAKLKAQTWTAKGTYHAGGMETPFTAAYAWQVPGQFRMETKGAFEFTLIINRDQGWANGRKITADQLASQKEGLYASWVTSRFPLKDKALAVTQLDEAVVAGRPAFGIKVSSKGHRDITIYFDKKTGLMAKTLTRVDSGEPGKDIEQEMLASDYKDFGGIKVPMKYIVKRDGKLFVETEFTGWKGAEKLDEKLFANPQSKENPAMSDQERLQGIWQVVSGVANGKTLPEEVVTHHRLTFTGDKLVARSKDRVTIDGKFRLNPGKNPKEIDVELDGSVGRGIYEWDGDQLKLVHGEVGGERPAKFESKEASGSILMVLKRVKP